MGCLVERWDYARRGAPGLMVIRSLHQPAARFRISLWRYPAGAAFGGVSRAGRLFMIEGGCAITVGSSVCELVAGDIADLPEGAYYLRVLGQGSVEFVRVWQLPPGFWKNGGD